MIKEYVQIIDLFVIHSLWIPLLHSGFHSEHSQPSAKPPALTVTTPPHLLHWCLRDLHEHSTECCKPDFSSSAWRHHEIRQTTTKKQPTTLPQLLSPKKNKQGPNTMSFTCRVSKIRRPPKHDIANPKVTYATPFFSDILEAIPYGPTNPTNPTCRSVSKPAALIFLNQLVARSASPAWSPKLLALGCEYMGDSWIHGCPFWWIILSFIMTCSDKRSPMKVNFHQLW